MLQKSLVTVAIFILCYLGFIVRSGKPTIAEAQCFCNVFSLLFLDETHFFSVATMLNIVKLFEMKCKVKGDLFSEE